MIRKFYFFEEIPVIMQKDKTYAKQTVISNHEISSAGIPLPPDVLAASYRFVSGLNLASLPTICFLFISVINVFL